MKTVRIGKVYENSLIDSTGIAHVIYFYGCYKDCDGCFNQELRDINGGNEIDIEDVKRDIRKNSFASHVVFQGGEPFVQYPAVVELAEYAKSLGKRTWIYTGYTLEELANCALSAYGKTSLFELLKPFNVAIVGPYVEDMANENYYFLASSNQKIVIVKENELEIIDDDTDLTWRQDT